MEHGKVVEKLFKATGSPNEVKLYEEIFGKKENTYFAVIKVSGSVLSESLEQFTNDIAVLFSLGLIPIIVHGAGKQIDDAFAKRGIKSKKVAGVRYISQKQMPLVKGVIEKLKADLALALAAKGVAVETFDSSIAVAKPFAVKNTDGTADVEGIKLSKIKAAIKEKKIPLISPYGALNSKEYNINADTITKALAKELKPLKIIFLSSTSGILDQNNETISFITLKSDFQYLVKNKIVSDGMLLKLKQIKQLLQETDPKTTVQISSPENLLKELFTVKGAGTFIKIGSKIHKFDSFAKMNKSKIKKLLEEVFGYKLKANYFEKDCSLALVAEDYSGVIIVKKVGNMNYLDKFAVTPKAQGKGLGHDLWNVLEKEFTSFFWRTSKNNPLNEWYFKKGSGMQKSSYWNVYWKNMKPKYVMPAVEYAANLGKSFEGFQ